MVLNKSTIKLCVFITRLPSFLTCSPRAALMQNWITIIVWYSSYSGRLMYGFGRGASGWHVGKHDGLNFRRRIPLTLINYTTTKCAQ